MDTRKAEIAALAMIQQLVQWYPGAIPDGSDMPDPDVDCGDFVMEFSQCLANSQDLLDAILDNKS